MGQSAPGALYKPNFGKTKWMMKMTNSGHVSCVAKLSVRARRNGQSVKIAAARDDCTTGGHYYTCHNCDSE